MFPSPRSLGGGAAAYHVRAGRVPNPQGPPPPLPNGIPFRARDYRARLADSADSSPATPLRVLRGGCYLARYTPLQASPTQPGAIYYLGTLRVQSTGATVTISGDLYLRRVSVTSQPGVFAEPDPGDGIPVFPRQDYRYYMRATQVSDDPQSQESFTLGLEMFRFNSAVGTWSNDGALSAELSWTTTPPGYPSSADYLTGEMKNPAGAVAGTLTLGWLSPLLRRASIEIDRVAGGVAPRDNGAQLGWREVFEPVGWDVAVIESDTNVPEPSGESWGDAEMHAAMVERRDRREHLLDVEWRYHVLCVRRLDETERGIMYDASAADTNSTPREGLAIASDWVYPADPSWGELQGVRFGSDAATYFRTAVHELGHALGLYHNTADNGFMNTTDVIARRARPDRPFPKNIRWAFHPDDERRLRHMPDAWVRPGGIQFGEDYSVAPIAADDMFELPAGLRLDVRPLNELLPLGAPARIEFSLINESDYPVIAPASLSLKDGNVRGQVIDPAGTVRTFRPVVQCIETQALAQLAPQARLSHAATLIRGPQGPLFPSAGLYRVVVDVQWSEGSLQRGITGSADLLVTAAQTREQAEAAYGILSTPDTLLTIAASSNASAGVTAIERAVADPTLRPHYAWLEAKRLLRSPQQAAASQKVLETLSQCDPVLSSAERRRATEALDNAAGRAKPRPAARAGKTTAAARRETAADRAFVKFTTSFRKKLAER